MLRVTRALQPLPSLRNLDLVYDCSNQSAAVSAAIASLTQLTCLSLSGPWVCYQPGIVRPLRNLLRLTLGVPVRSKEEAQQLVADLPQLTYLRVQGYCDCRTAPYDGPVLRGSMPLPAGLRELQLSGEVEPKELLALLLPPGLTRLGLWKLRVAPRPPPPVGPGGEDGAPGDGDSVDGGDSSDGDGASEGNGDSDGDSASGDGGWDGEDEAFLNGGAASEDGDGGSAGGGDNDDDGRGSGGSDGGWDGGAGWDEEDGASLDGDGASADGGHDGGASVSSDGGLGSGVRSGVRTMGRRWTVTDVREGGPRTVTGPRTAMTLAVAWALTGVTRTACCGTARRAMTAPQAAAARAPMEGRPTAPLMVGSPMAGRPMAGFTIAPPTALLTMGPPTAGPLTAPQTGPRRGGGVGDQLGHYRQRQRRRRRPWWAGVGGAGGQGRPCGPRQRRRCFALRGPSLRLPRLRRAAGGGGAAVRQV